MGENINQNGMNLETFPFNGGGPGESSGGGATDVRLENGTWNDFNSLKSRIMVAAGGGGGAYKEHIDTSKKYVRGDGGTLIGIDAEFYFNNDNGGYSYSGHGATQTSGGEPGERFNDNDIDPQKTPEMTGTFGMGGYGIYQSKEYEAVYSSSGGGGGYYGGGHCNHPGNSWTGGGGGSSFISGYPGCKAIDENSTEGNISHLETSEHYSGKVFTNYVMKAGNEEMPTHDGLRTMTGNTGNGFAKITFIK